MNYTQFIIKMKESLQERLGADVTVETIHVPKNNGVMLQGLTIRKADDRVVPTIYLERFYEDYLEGRALEDILEDFLELYDGQEMMGLPDFAFFHDYEQVKEKLSVKLISRKKNKGMLKEMPSKNFLDMAVVFYCLVESAHAGTAAVVIKNSHMKKWGVSVDQLYEDALKNAERMLPGNIRTMEELLSQMVLEEDASAWECRQEESEDFPKLDGFVEKNKEQGVRGIPLLILTNTRRYLGASCILYKGLLGRVAREMGRNLYILPSSIHEVILLPENHVQSAHRLIRMVTEVNRTQLEAEEVLSDSVYYFDRKTGEISIYDMK